MIRDVRIGAHSRAACRTVRQDEVEVTTSAKMWARNVVTAVASTFTTRRPVISWRLT
jgi:hypothetical protein